MCFWYIFQFGRLTPRCDFDCFRLDWYTSLCAYLVSHQPSQFSYSPQSHPASQEYHVIHMECSLPGPETGSFYSTYLESYGCCESIYFDQHRWDMVGWSSDIFLLNIFGEKPNLWAPHTYHTWLWSDVWPRLKCSVARLPSPNRPKPLESGAAVPAWQRH